jgi:hypothetical protein
MSRISLDVMSQAMRVIQALNLSKHRIYTVADFVDAREDRLLANGIDV